jgi:hypothetical protein
LLPGAVNETDAVVEPHEIDAEPIVGAPGVVHVVTAALAVLAGPVPAALVAVTV